MSLKIKDGPGENTAVLLPAAAVMGVEDVVAAAVVDAVVNINAATNYPALI